MTGGTVLPALLLILSLPIMSAYAESFTVTTNKDIYTLNEKVIIIGVVPDDAPEGYAVLLQVNGPDGTECSQENLLPHSDNSFVSRPISLKECGTGEYTVLAYYAEMPANSTFSVSNSTRNDGGSRLELRMLKNVILQAQETVKQRLREFIETNSILPEDIADRYSQGVSEASLVLQAIDFGNTAEAKKHLIFSIANFREVINALPAQRAIFDQAVQSGGENGEDALLERYKRLKEFYFRLEEVAEKNGVDRQNDFGTIVSLLARSKQMIDEGEVQNASSTLGQVNSMLEEIRQNLFEDDESEDSPSGNATTEEDIQARRLMNAAERFEKRALNLLDESTPQGAASRIQEALALIAEAKVSVSEGNYDDARDALSEAYDALNDAEQTIDDDKKGSKKSSEGSDDEQDEADDESSGQSSSSGTG